MALTPIPAFTFNHADQVDRPAIDAATIKTEFDSRSKNVRDTLEDNWKSEITEGAYNYAVSAAGSDSYAVTITNVAALTTGLEVSFKADVANTGAATLQVNAFTVTAIRKNGTTVLEDGDIPAGGIAHCRYDGTNFQLQNPTKTTALTTHLADGAAHGIRTTLTTGDLNNITTPGFYSVGTAVANTPVAGVMFGVLVTYVSTDKLVQQIAIHKDNGDMYVRRSYDTGSARAWDAWYKVAKDSSVTTVQTNLTNHQNNLTAHGVDKQSLFRQALINGNLDVWQRGTSFSNQNNAYTVDRWKIIDNIDNNVKVLQSSSVPNKVSNYSLRVESLGTSGANALSDIVQFIENYSFFAGQTVTLSGYYKCDNGVTAAVLIDDGVTVTTLGDLTSTTWTPFSITATVNANLTRLSATLRLIRNNLATGLGVNFAQVQLNVGSVALPFSPKSFADELRLCQRYCYQLDSLLHLVSVAYTANILYFWLPTQVTLRITPSLVLGAESTDWQIITPSIIAQTGFSLSIVSTSVIGVLIAATKISHGLSNASLKILTGNNRLDAEL